MNKNYYEILEVSEKASIETIKAAYRSLAKKYHADNGNENQEQMALVNEAYEVLSDENKKAEYDAMLNRGTGKSYSSNNYQEAYEEEYEEDEEIAINLFGQNIVFGGNQMRKYIIQAVLDNALVEPICNKLQEQFEKNMCLKIFEDELQEEPLKKMNNFVKSIKAEVSSELTKIGKVFSIDDDMSFEMESHLKWDLLEDTYQIILNKAKECMIDIYNTYGLASTDIKKDQERLDYERRMSNGLLSSIYMTVTDSIADDIRKGRIKPADREREVMVENAVSAFKKYYREFLIPPKLVLYSCLIGYSEDLDEQIKEINKLCDRSDEMITQGSHNDKGMLAKAFRYNPLNSDFYRIMVSYHFESCHQLIGFINQCKLQKYAHLGVLKCSYFPSDKYKEINKNAKNVFGCSFIKAIDMQIIEKVTLLLGTMDAKCIDDDKQERAFIRLDEYSKKFGKADNYFAKDLSFLYVAKGYSAKRKAICEELELMKESPKTVAETQEYIDSIKANNEPYIYESIDGEFKELIIHSVNAELDADYNNLKSKDASDIIEFVADIKTKYDEEIFEKCSIRFMELLEIKVADEVKEKYEHLDKSDVDGLKALLKVVQGEYSKYKCATEYIDKIKNDIIIEQEKHIEAEIKGLEDKNVDEILAYINNAQENYIAEVYNKYIDSINQIIEDKIDTELKSLYEAVNKDDVEALEQLRKKCKKEYKSYRASDKYVVALKKDIRVAKEKQLEIEVQELKSKDTTSIKLAIDDMKKKYDSELFDKQAERCQQILKNQAEKEMNSLYEAVDKMDIDAMKKLKEKIASDYSEFEISGNISERLTNDIYAESKRRIYEELGDCLNSSLNTNLAMELTRKVEQTECEEIVKKQIYDEIKNQLIDNNMACIDEITAKIRTIYSFTNNEQSKFIFFKKVETVNEAEILKGIEKVVVKLAVSGVTLEQPILSHLREGLLDLPSQLTGFSITQKSLLYYEKGIVNTIPLADIADFVIQKKLMSTDIFVTTFSGMSIKLATKFPKDILNNVPVVLKETVRMIMDSSIYSA